VNNLPPSSSQLDVSEMQIQSRAFVKERAWEKFHTPKNIAIGLSIEAAELSEIFHWLTDDESFNIKADPSQLSKVEDELGDILHYLIRIADVLNIDLNEAYWHKFNKIKEKYPVEAVKGKADHYAKLH
jgi:NTP pyrophosphatase (non-canonical NTP hydrolase)